MPAIKIIFACTSKNGKALSLGMSDGNESKENVRKDLLEDGDHLFWYFSARPLSSKYIFTPKTKQSSKTASICINKVIHSQLCSTIMIW